LPPMYSSQPVTQPVPQMYLSQPLILSHFPPDQEQFLNMQRPSMAPVPQQTCNQHTSRLTSTSEDEQDRTHMVQDVPTWFKMSHGRL
jgi:hypothetical protein